MSKTRDLFLNVTFENKSGSGRTNLLTKLTRLIKNNDDNFISQIKKSQRKNVKILAAQAARKELTLLNSRYD